ncbi:MAG TPA: GTPase HflX [Acidimicrobiales bacterium]|nr:GTPase HflX [Acidimicrobiales bacterium]
MTLIERTFRERIILVGVVHPGQTEDEVEASLDELAQLIDTAGADVLARVVQRRDRPDPATYIGSGKAEELHVLSLEVDADTVVFDDGLTPAQQRNLEKILGRTAIDRTAVILDIFAQNARTQEGKDQVELALLRYRLPRLRGRRQGLDQQRQGGLANRGPGETALETDRRRMLERITRLERNLVQLGRTRRTQRKARQRGRNRAVSLVGYTNTGKSTLLNRLTDAGVLAENRLFATLDPRTRRLDLPGGEMVLLSDTVGFVKKLPHQLVQAFRSTLEVVGEADLLVHVVDAAAADPVGQMEAVRTVLTEIGAGGVPQLVCVNKADLDPEAAARIARHNPGAVVVSGVTGAGALDLLRAVGDRLRELTNPVELLVPWDRGDVIAAVHREGEVLSEAHEEAGARIRARLDGPAQSRFEEFAAVATS